MNTVPKTFGWVTNHWRLKAVVTCALLFLGASCAIVTKFDYFEPLAEKGGQRQCVWHNLPQGNADWKCTGLCLYVSAGIWSRAVAIGPVIPVVPTPYSSAERRKAEEEMVHVGMWIKSDNDSAIVALNDFILIVHIANIEQRLRPSSYGEFPNKGSGDLKEYAVEPVQTIEAHEKDRIFGLVYPVQIKQVQGFTLVFPPIRVGQSTITPEPLRFVRKTAHDYEGVM
jgi:hypothetical protein